MKTAKTKLVGLLRQEYKSYQKHARTLRDLRKKLYAISEEHKMVRGLASDVTIIDIIIITNSIIQKMLKTRGKKVNDAEVVGVLNFYYGGELRMGDFFEESDYPIRQLTQKLIKKGISPNATFSNYTDWSLEFVRNYLPFGDVSYAVKYFKDRIKYYQDKYAPEPVEAQ